MALTPSDIEQKTFATAFKGYDLAEVDDFLDEVISTIRDLEEKLTKAQSGSSEAPVAVAAVTEVAPAPVVTADETAIGRALLVAQQAADRILDEAREEADRIKTEARVEADSWESDKAAKKAEAEAAIGALNEKVAGVRRELAALVNTLADGIDEMDHVLEDASGSISDDGVIEVTVDDSVSAESVDSAESEDVEDFEAWEISQAELDQATT